jgi:hypothetical protein
LSSNLEAIEAAGKPTLTQAQTDEKALLEKLAEIGGMRVANSDLIYKGNQLILPERWTGDPSAAVDFLEEFIEANEEETSFSRTFRYRPWDGAHALQAALTRVFGTSGIGKATYSFFGKNPPEMRTIPIGVEETVQVPWGAMAVPLFGGTLYTGGTRDAEYGILFQITVETKRKYQAHVEGLFVAVENELRTNSIYRGKAVNGSHRPRSSWTCEASIPPRSSTPTTCTRSWKPTCGRCCVTRS